MPNGRSGGFFLKRFNDSGGLTANDLVAFAIDPTNPSRMYVAMKKSLHRSENGGATFTASKLEPTAVVVDGKGNVYVATDERVSRSSDGGKRGLHSATG